jgi:Arc/MetJ-type ribon-helix-helix transcriptional regulator
MPIMSFSISEELKKMIQSLVEKKKAFKNQSGFVRTALTHYINTAEAQISLDDEIEATEYKVSGQVALTLKKGENENKVLKEIYGCEAKYSDQVATFQLTSANMNTYSCLYTFHGSIFDFRKFVDDLDSVKGIEQLRYLISE